MSAGIHIVSGSELREWLQGKPRSWAQVIASRTALRVLPAVNRSVTKGKSVDQRAATAIVSVVRANFISPVAIAHPDPEIIADAAAAFAADAAAHAADAHAAAAAHATDAAFAAAYATDDAFAANAAAFAADAAAHAAAEAATAYAATPDAAAVYAASAADAVWLSISNDAMWLEANQEASPASLLFSQLLWHGRAPNSILVQWHQFARSRFAAENGFQPWARWYEALACLEGTGMPRNIFGESLSKRIATQPKEWWKRPAKEINADVAAWLREEEVSRLQPVPEQALADALDTLPPQQSAPYLFDWHDGRMEVLPPDSLPEDGGLAQDYLDETRDKASDLSERLNGRNFDPNIRRKVGKLLEVLTERVADLRPAIVDSRTISVERLAGALDNPQDAAELPSDILADLGDLADTARRLCQCLPALWKRDVERLADSLTADSAAALLTHLDAMREGIKEAEIVGPEVHAAFDTLSEESAEAAADDLKRRRIAMYGLTARNFLTALLKGAKGSASAMAGILTSYAQKTGKEIPSEFYKGSAKLVIKGGLVLAAAACLYFANIESIRQVSRYFAELERVNQLLDAIKGKGEAPSPPPSPPPAPSPRPPRPKSERDPTRSA